MLAFLWVFVGFPCLCRVSTCLHQDNVLGEKVEHLRRRLYRRSGLASFFLISVFTLGPCHSAFTATPEENKKGLQPKFENAILLQ